MPDLHALPAHCVTAPQLVNCIHPTAVPIVHMHNLRLDDVDSAVARPLLIERHQCVDTHVVGEEVGQALIIPR